MLDDRSIDAMVVNVPSKHTVLISYETKKECVEEHGSSNIGKLFLPPPSFV